MDRLKVDSPDKVFSRTNRAAECRLASRTVSRQDVRRVSQRGNRRRAVSSFVADNRQGNQPVNKRDNQLVNQRDDRRVSQRANLPDSQQGNQVVSLQGDRQCNQQGSRNLHPAATGEIAYGIIAPLLHRCKFKFTPETQP
jgi:hypothetical protein